MNTLTVRHTVFLIGLLMHTDLPAQVAVDRLSRENLLLFRDDQGVTRPVRSPAEWLNRRREITDGMQKITGPLPGDDKRCALDIRLEHETDCGSYWQRLISYAAEPHGRVPAYLLVPKTATPAQASPAILCLHPTDNQVGHKVVVDLGGRPNRQYAQELAQRGYVTLAPAYPLLADYQPDLDALGYRSGTMKAMWDNIRGLDLLDSLPYVRPGRYGAIGHSLGGHNAVFTAVFDQRIVAVVTSCGLDSFLDYMHGDIRGWTSQRYMPRLLDYRDRLRHTPFDFHELVGALRPRHCLIVAPLRDSNFHWESVDRVAKAASRVYRLYDAADRLKIEHPDCEHDFPKPMREMAYRLFDTVLRQTDGAGIN